VRFQNSTVDFAFTRTKGEFAVRIENAGESIHLRFNPQLPLGAQVLRGSVCGHKAAWSVLQKKSDEHALLDFEVPHGSCDVTITFRHGIELILPAPDVTLGQPSSGMKLTSTRTNANTLELGVDAMSNRENKVTIRTARVIRSAVHAKVARIAEDLYELIVNLDTRDANYQHVNVRVNFAE